jgi:uncharacterized protein YegJ (DUF2314 family)
MTAKVRLASLLLVSILPLALACAGATPKAKQPVAAAQELPALTVPPLDGPLEQPFRFFAVTLYLDAPAPDDLRGLVDSVRKKHFPELQYVEGEPDGSKVPAIYAKRASAEEVPPPSLEELEYFGVGLSPEQGKQAVASTHALALLFVDATASSAGNLPRQNAVVSALAERLHGFVWDNDTRQLFARDAYAPRLEANPSMLDHITVHAYRNGELVRLVTLGMAKFGLPDVEVNHVAASDARGTGMLLNVLCSLLAQGERPGTDGGLVLSLDAVRDAKLRAALEPIQKASKSTPVVLRRTKGQEGDTSEELLELFFGEADDRFVHERRQAALASFYGMTDDAVSVEHDAELLAASERAKKRLGELRPAFDRGLAPGEHLAVKAPFKTDDGGDEWMWVEVVSWEGSAIHGILMNDPENVSGLVSGAKVQIKQDDVFDYLFARADGSSEGNETGEIMQRRIR